MGASYLIDAHTDHLTLEGYSDRTINDRTRLLQRLDHHTRRGLGRAEAAEIRSFLAHKKWKRWTRCTYDMHIRSAYDWWCLNGYLDGNPVTWPAPRRPKLVPRPATDDEVAIALRLPEPVGTAALLAVYGGLRGSESADCHREHVTESSVFIPSAKGGDPAMVVTHPAVWEAVRDRPPGPLVRHHRTGAAVDGPWLIDTARRWFAQAGLEIRLHALRHWHATTLLLNGANLRTVQECMRHASIQSTAGYTKVVDEQRRAAVLSLKVPGTRASR